MAPTPEFRQGQGQGQGQGQHRQRAAGGIYCDTLHLDLYIGVKSVRVPASEMPDRMTGGLCSGFRNERFGLDGRQAGRYETA